MTTFTDLGLAEPILKSIATEGYDTPTPIQAQVIPLMLAGQDVLGIAQTGTGKTAAFVLPLLHKLESQRKTPLQPRMPKSCKALILAPTRELANQILESVRTYGRHLHLTSALVVGGANPSPQIRALSQGLDILVATPGRLLDHLQAKHARLDQTHTIVLDEADQMMDLGFMPAIRDLLARLPKSRQTLLLSATMPADIRRLADEFLQNPAEVSVAQHSKPIERIAQHLIMVDPGKKPEALLDLLAAPDVEQAIVFTRTKHGAERVQKHIRDHGHFSVSIHGDKTQGQRDRALAAFRSGKMRVLVATDVAARGIDIDTVTHVVNYDMPIIPEAYVHRIGRTGRAGRSGTAYSLCEPSEVGLAIQIERLTGQTLLPEGVRRQRPGGPRPGFKPGGKPGGKSSHKPSAKPAQRASGPRPPRAEGQAQAPKPYAAKPTGPKSYSAKPSGSGPVGAKPAPPRPAGAKPASKASKYSHGKRPTSPQR